MGVATRCSSNRIKMTGTLLKQSRCWSSNICQRYCVLKDSLLRSKSTKPATATGNSSLDALSTESNSLKKQRKKKKETVETAESDQDIKNSLLIPFISFEGSSSDGDSVSSIDKEEDTTSDRVYHIQTSMGNHLSYPSVTTVLQKTVDSGSQFRLKQWKMKLTKEQGKEKFERYYKNILKTGINFHKEIEEKLKKELKSSGEINTKFSRQFIRKEEMLGANPTTTDVECSESHFTSKEVGGPIQDLASDADALEMPLYTQSIDHVLKDITEVKALEASVAHLQLGYAGTFDCLAKYRGMLCLIDWKTARKPKPSLADCFDYPLQMAAYAGAINQDPKLDTKVLNMLLVIAYESGEPCNAHFINHELCQKYWLKWLQRLQDYQTQFSHDLSEIIC